jgi:transcriptional regulator with XRE-family HTH domain
MTLGEKLKELRKDYRFTQVSLSRIAGMCDPWYFMVEKESRPMTVKVLKGFVAISKAYGMTLEKLLEGVDE